MPKSPKRELQKLIEFIYTWKSGFDQNQYCNTIDLIQMFIIIDIIKTYDHSYGSNPQANEAEAE